MKLLLFFLTFITFNLTGQSIPEAYDTPEKRCEMVTNEMIQNLPLQPAEIPVIKSLNLKYARIVQKEILDPELNWWSAYFKMREINKKKEKELLPLLSSTQKTNYEKMKTAARKKLWDHFF